MTQLGTFLRTTAVAAFAWAPLAAQAQVAGDVTLDDGGASANVSVGGVDADANLSLGGGGADADASVDAGRNTDADASVSLGGGGRTSADVSVGGGGTDADVSLGGGGADGNVSAGGGTTDASVSIGGGGGTGGGGAGGGAGGGGAGAGAGGDLVGGGTAGAGGSGGGAGAPGGDGTGVEVSSDPRAYILGNGQPAAVLIGMVVYSSDRVALGVVSDIAGFDGTNLRLAMTPNASLGLPHAVIQIDVPVDRLTRRELHLSMTAAEFVRSVSA